jgi:hypothetical protein
VADVVVPTVIRGKRLGGGHGSQHHRRDIGYLCAGPKYSPPGETEALWRCWGAWCRRIVCLHHGVVAHFRIDAARRTRRAAALLLSTVRNGSTCALTLHEVVWTNSIKCL